MICGSIETTDAWNKAKAVKSGGISIKPQTRAECIEMGQMGDKDCIACYYQLP